ncbi:MAG: hypothetical protein V2I82_02135 [Halieaceae bacterium]|jgi:hypothetical protein|nr:hypothetical protein [Halieaceae bacterium]
MAGSRGAANQSLYRARILLDCWDAARQASRFPDKALDDAFLPAVRAHLCDAYGWFLLAVSGVEQTSQAVALPASTADLPAPEAGRSIAPELREFAVLEREGWLADLIATPAAEAPLVDPRAAGEILGSDRQAPGYAVIEALWSRLSNTMQRMDDSLAEC